LAFEAVICSLGTHRTVTRETRFSSVRQPDFAGLGSDCCTLGGPLENGVGSA
jgi:hypothetical protein